MREGTDTNYPMKQKETTLLLLLRWGTVVTTVGNERSGTSWVIIHTQVNSSSWFIPTIISYVHIECQNKTAVRNKIKGPTT